MKKFALILRQPVKDFYETLSMTTRRNFKRALEGLGDERGDIKPLESPLDGYYRLRVGSVRVIFHYEAPKTIVCDYAEKRSLVYEFFEAEIARRLSGES